MEYLKNKEAMLILGITTPDALKRRLKKGLKCYGEGRERRFKESDIKDYMEGKK